MLVISIRVNSVNSIYKLAASQYTSSLSLMHLKRKYVKSEMANNVFYAKRERRKKQLREVETNFLYIHQLFFD